MSDVKISLNQNEANGLCDLIDIAVKSQGLKVASQAAYFLKKITAPFSELEKSAEVEKGDQSEV